MSRHEKITAQCQAAERTEAELLEALDDLAAAAKQAAKRRGRLETVYGAVNRVRRAEEAHDLALLDVATARGEDA